MKKIVQGALWWRLAADFVMIFHTLLVVIGVGGALVIYRHHALILPYLLLVSVVLLIDLASGLGMVCPLTSLECFLRKKYHPTWAFSGGGYVARFFQWGFGRVPSPRTINITSRFLESCGVVWALWVWYH